MVSKSTKVNHLLQNISNRIFSLKLKNIKKDYHVIGIRPGEKLHEIMVPEEMAHHTVEFEDHFVIAPAITFFDKNLDYFHNKLGEKGVPSESKFEYHSGTNSHFLSIDELKELDKVTL